MSINTVYARGWVPHTCIAMSSTIRISGVDANDGARKQIGLIQSFRPTDTRRMERARGVGYGDRVAEIVPGTTDVAVTIVRMAMYTQSFHEAVGYTAKYNEGTQAGAVRTLAHHKNPFDVDEIIWFHEEAPPTKQFTLTIYHDCWMNSYARTIDITGNLILMEDVGVDVTWVSDGIEPGPYAETDAMGEMHGLFCDKNRDIVPRLEGFQAGNSLSGGGGGGGVRGVSGHPGGAFRSFPGY